MISIDDIMADVRKFAGLIEPAFAIVAIAQQITGLGGGAAATGIQVLDSAIKAFAAGVDGDLTSEEVMAELAKLKVGLDANDAAADAALAAKFTTP